MTPRSASVAAHAKVNLVLRVLERDKSGYHQIETLFQRLALADDVTVAVTDGACSLDVRWDDEPETDLGPAEHNLAWRSAAAYRSVAGWPRGWEITLTKRIPAGAGLGGGSADAAGVLRALDQLAPNPLGSERLGRLGATLGSDVAFFVADTALAIGRGHGEQLRPLEPVGEAAVVLAIPPFGIATAEAYKRLAAARVTAAPVALLHDSGDFSTWAAIANQQVNDFEPTVFASHPELQEVRRWFEENGAQIARLSGSGSVVFGLWPAPRAPSLAPPLAPPPGFRLLRTMTK